MESLKIWLVTILVTMAYGVAHDQVTARVSIEYFTIGHEPFVPTSDPTVTALAWGVAATWWIGAFAGLLFAFVARFGSAPKVSVRDLLPAGGALIAGVACIALLAGLAGFAAAQLGHATLPAQYAADVPDGAHGRFIADMWAHRAAYIAGFCGNVALAVWVWLARLRKAAPTPPPVLAPPAPV